MATDHSGVVRGLGVMGALPSRLFLLLGQGGSAASIQLRAWIALWRARLPSMKRISRRCWTKQATGLAGLLLVGLA